MIRGLILHPRIDVPDIPSRLHAWLRSPAFHRVLRFGTSGAISAVFQLAVLWALLDVDLRTAAANLLAFLAGAQLNFTLNRYFTWRDRAPSTSAVATWARFMCAVSATATLNLGVFAIADRVIPSLLAAAIGIGVVAVVNFFLGDRAIFASASTAAPSLTGIVPSNIEPQEIQL
ncbi:MAG: GtrA family protein [Tepidiformaceae bacterium]